MKTTRKKTTSAKNPCFFAISCSRVFWLDILSLGFYQLYWFYKNWQALRAAGQKVNPVVRAWIFPPFFVFQLFANIKNKIAPDRKTSFCLRTAPVLFIFDVLLSVFVPDEIMIWLLPEIIVIILSAVVMRVIQKAVNDYNAIQNPEIRLRRSPTAGEAVAVLLMPVLFLASFAYGYFNAYIRYKNIININKPQNFLTAVTFKHLSVYPFVCEKQGYIMKNYQQAFLRTYADEIEIYENHLHDQGMTMIEAWQKQPQNVINFIIALTFQELEDIRGSMEEETAKAGNHPAAASFGKKISAKQACTVLDKSADAVFDQNKNLKTTFQQKIKSF